MKNVGSALLAVCAAAAFSPSAGAQVLPYRLVQAGRPLKMVFLFSIEPNCRSRGATTVAVVTPPGHGALSTQETMDFPVLSQSQPAAHCGRQRVPGVAVYYQGTSGYSGPDTFTVQAQFPNGYVTNYPYNILVR